MQAAWGNIVAESRLTGMAGSTASLGSTSVGAVLSINRGTLARVRGSVVGHMVPVAANAAGLLAVGLIVSKSEAFSVGGITSVPSPFTDVDDSWLWHHIFAFGPAIDAAEDGDDLLQTSRILIDSKAQRKMQTDDTIHFVWESKIDAGAPTWEGYAACRIMVLLP